MIIAAYTGSHPSAAALACAIAFLTAVIGGPGVGFLLADRAERRRERES